MTSLWPSAIASLNDSLAVLYGSVGRLRAAKAVEPAELMEQLKLAAESSRNLRALVLAEMPEASWHTREELEALLQEIERRVEARKIEQQRNRLLALAGKLEQGKIVHRRAARMEQMNQLREQAIKELRAQAAVSGAPCNLPGPEADQWLEWAFGLNDPQDAESLQSIRNGYAHLDEFVANLEPNMWTV